MDQVGYEVVSALQGIRASENRPLPSANVYEALLHVLHWASPTRSPRTQEGLCRSPGGESRGVLVLAGVKSSRNSPSLSRKARKEVRESCPAACAGIRL